MVFKGKRIRVPKWIHGDDCILRVEVEAVIPDADPSEPCLEAPTLRYLDTLQEFAKAGNITELKKHGAVYVRQVDAAIAR